MSSSDPNTDPPSTGEDTNNTSSNQPSDPDPSGSGSGSSESESPQVSESESPQVDSSTSDPQGGIAPACIPVPAYTQDLGMEGVPDHRSTLINTGDHHPDTIPTTTPEELLDGTDADIGLGPLTITTAPPALTLTPASLSLRTDIADLGDTGQATPIAGHIILLRPPQAPAKDLLANDTIPQAHHLMAVHLATIITVDIAVTGAVPPATTGHIKNLSVGHLLSPNA